MGLSLPSIRARVAAASEITSSRGQTAGTVLPRTEWGFGWIFLVLPVTFTLSFRTSVTAGRQLLVSEEGMG